jgi:amino acid adenylation domain-containing protein
MVATTKTNLANLFYSSASRYPDRPALIIDTHVYCYHELLEKTHRIALWLRKNHINRLGIFASRSLEAYAGVLAAQWTGAAYIPLNPAFPAARLQKMEALAQLDAILMDPLRASQHSQAPIFSVSLLWPFSETPSYQATDSLAAPSMPSESALAYIIFTSGSTGEPKGVSISVGNLHHFILAIQDRYELTCNDRVSQFSSLSFDVSLFDMILAWSCGAALYVIPENTLLAPAAFIRENQLTVWLAVPSIITIMEKFGMLKENSFPSLKYSLFTGEAITCSQADAWLRAAPTSQLDNLYGPTEVTIDCLAHTYHHDTASTTKQDLVPIGRPFKTLSAAIINSQQQFLSAGEQGELVLAGPQLSSGYWQDPEKTAQKFIVLHHPQLGKQTWYLTGDCCYQDHTGTFHYLYRLDNQHKILGQRFELEDIEYQLRRITACHEVAALFMESNDPTHAQIVAVISNATIDIAAVEQELREQLPPYMIPSSILLVDVFPYNANGKLDRKALSELASKKLHATRENSA